MVCAQVKIPDCLGSKYSTYRIGGLFEEAYQPTSLDEALELLQYVCDSKKQLTVIGAGSNLIVASGGIEGITLLTRKMTRIQESFADDQKTVEVLFGAGVHLAKAATFVESLGMTGAEYMIGIPGTIGGAVRMNAGAMGQETSEVVRSVRLFNLRASGPEHWPLEKLAYQYRSSAIDPAIHIVLEARMVFKGGDPTEIRAKMQGNLDFRKAHHPTTPNGGSVFKNPYPKGTEKAHMTAGWMLDQLGTKDWTEGDVRVSPKHANFIENIGNGTSTDLLRLMCRMKQAVKAVYEVELYPENLFIGKATDEEAALWKELTGGAHVGMH